MTSKGAETTHTSIEDMVDDFDHDYEGQDGVTQEKSVIGKGLRKTLLSAAALVAVIGFGSHYVEGAGLSEKPSSLVQLKAGDVSSDPLGNKGSAYIPGSDEKLARLEDEVLGRIFSSIEPTSGEPAPQILGGSDDQTPPMPVAVEQSPAMPSDMPPGELMASASDPAPEVVEIPPPAPDAAVLASPVDGGNPAPVSPDQAAPEPEPVAASAVLPPPDVAVMTPPAAATAASSAPGLPSEAVSGRTATNRLTPEPGSDKPDVYYDSSLNVPTGPLAETVGPRKVDPVLEPASKLIVSKQTAKASDMEAQLIAANRALDLGRYESALEMFDQLYSKNQRDTRILMGRAVAQQKLGMDDVAILSYEALLDLVPNNTDAIVNMMGLLKKQYPSVALRRLTDLRAKYPANAGIAAQLGMTYAELGENQEALRALGAAASLEPENPQHIYNMAVIADRAGSRALAIQYYEQSLQEDAVYGGGRSVPREKIYDRLSTLRQ